ncbi:protein ILRUN isoform X2 [Marmota monax]|uniref:protein ILRUN isoform X2 n=1 Tax=Marmota monax TaxID=9995 RepID=UPI0026EC76BD|nr:protein ILRUN isoform X2 [Marmota monax]
MEGMDVDLDPELMQKFSCLGTTDKDVLISEFQRLLGFQLNPAGCAFFLDMTNWNLQAAIGAYYDFESPNISVPSMSFVKDVTIGEGESIPPDTQFIKTWRIQNSDVIWVILSVEVGGLLGVTQQLSSFETEFNTQPHRKVEGNFNPFASPQKNRQSDENNLKDPGGSGFDSISKNTWAPAPDQTEQDQNRLSQNSVNLSPSSHANNLSVVTYSKPPQFLGLQTGHHHAQLNISCAIYANLQKSQTHLVPAISGAPRALPLRPVLNGCQQEEKLTKDRRPDFGGEGKGFLWIANHIARIPALISHPGRRGRSKTELVLSKLSMHV